MSSGTEADATGAARPRILVIKLGAFGDFIQAFAPFQAIRRGHPDAHVTLLTTRPFQALALASGWFDAVWLDDRPPLWRVWRWLALRRRLHAGQFSRVYDLQTSDRSGWYFRLFWPERPDWSGAVAGCSFRHADPGRDRMHTLDRQAEQLAIAGLETLETPDLAWLDSDPGGYGVRSPYVVIVPGGAAHRPDKRWPAAKFGALASGLLARGVRPVLVGGPADTESAAAVAAVCPGALVLVGRTDLFELAGLLRRAEAAVGNDTGPMHLAAALGRPAVVLFSDASDPALCAPRGSNVRVLRRSSLAALPVEEVEAALRLR